MMIYLYILERDKPAQSEGRERILSQNANQVAALAMGCIKTSHT